MITHDNPTINSIIPKEERQQKHEQKRKEDRFILLIKITFFLFLLFILLIGCHLDATYTIEGSVYSINGKEITFEDTTGNLFSYYTEEGSPNVHKGEKFVLKFDHKGTESDRFDDGLINYGKHSFLCFVW